mmetsp:Transcript_24365/g.37748  ORF Transcript_24365/g.37748 Transcript_24365/m.37748 type:complete len:81 (+) Transcript_24365:1941-2183(+)
MMNLKNKFEDLKFPSRDQSFVHIYPQAMDIRAQLTPLPEVALKATEPSNSSALLEAKLKQQGDSSINKTQQAQKYENQIF